MQPALTDAALARALDNPVYRARRIGLPLLAFCLGLGKPAWILQIYALLNFAFWLLLFAALGRYAGYRRPRDLLLALALLWSTGTLISMARALTDFPATVLGFLAMFSCRHWLTTACFFGATGLFRETSVLSFAAAPWRDQQHGIDKKRLLVLILIMGLPLALWLIYVQAQLAAGAMAGNNQSFAFPLLGFVHKLTLAANNWMARPAGGPFDQQAVRAFEVLCPLSLVVPSAYLAIKPRLGSAAWRYGIGFALLFALLGDSVWEEQIAYCRALLPLTFSFNLLLHQFESGQRFTTWYLAGNVGLCWDALNCLL